MAFKSDQQRKAVMAMLGMKSRKTQKSMLENFRATTPKGSRGVSPLAMRIPPRDFAAVMNRLIKAPARIGFPGQKSRDITPEEQATILGVQYPKFRAWIMHASKKHMAAKFGPDVSKWPKNEFAGVDIKMVGIGPTNTKPRGPGGKGA